MAPVPCTLGRYAALLYLVNGTAGLDEVRVRVRVRVRLRVS